MKKQQKCYIYTRVSTAIQVDGYNLLIHDGDKTMAMSYNKLWKMLIDKGMKRAELRDAVDMSTNTLAKLDMKNLQTAKYNVDRLLKSEQSKEQDEKQKTTEQTL